MSEAMYREDWRRVEERLTRLEEKGSARDERMERMEHAIETLVKRVEEIGADVRDAKTGLRLGLWFASTVAPAGAAVFGWFAHHIWGK